PMKHSSAPTEPSAKTVCFRVDASSGQRVQEQTVLANTSSSTRRCSRDNSGGAGSAAGLTCGSPNSEDGVATGGAAAASGAVCRVGPTGSHSIPARRRLSRCCCTCRGKFAVVKSSDIGGCSHRQNEKRRQLGRFI